MQPLLVVSGLPGSGKSTVGRAIAEALSLPLLDKDDVLEALFTALGTGDASWRERLSRAADQVLIDLARQPAASVVVSWWRHPRSESPSGTGTDWLCAMPRKIVEVHCRCRPHVAVERFFARPRHAGHLDHLKSPPAELVKFERAAALGPLDVGALVVCDTELPRDLASIVRAVEAAGFAR